MSLRAQIDRAAGFTLLEAVIALALMAMILTALTTITGQWLPNWNRGVIRVQSSEQVARALERILEDISAAEFISSSSRSKRPLFDGMQNAVMFVRPSLGPNASMGLDVVRIAEVASEDGPMVLRTRLPFVPNSLPLRELAARVVDNPVVILRSPYRVTIDYASRGGEWQPTWRTPQLLPSAVRLSVHNTSAKVTLTSAISVKAVLPAECVTAKSPAECLTSFDNDRPNSL